MMTATLDDVAKKSKREPTAEEMVRRARQQGLSLTRPDGPLKQRSRGVGSSPSQVRPTTLLQNIPHRVSSAQA